MTDQRKAADEAARAAAFQRVVDDDLAVLMECEAVIAKHARRRMHFALVIYAHGDAGAAKCQFHLTTNIASLEIVEKRLAKMLADWHEKGGVGAIPVETQQQH